MSTLDRQNCKRKICFLSSGHSANDIRIFHKEAKSLLQAGFQVVLIVSGEKDTMKDGITILAVSRPKNRIARFFITPFFILIKALQVRADAYQFFNVELIPLALLLNLMGKKVVYDVLEELPDQVFFKQWIPKFLRVPFSKLIAWLESYAAKKCFAVIAAGDELGKKLKQYHSNTVVIQNYPTKDELLLFPDKTENRPDHNVIASLGGICHERAAPQIIDAIEIVSKHFNVKLMFAGTVESQKMIDWLIISTSIEQIVESIWQEKDYNKYQRRGDNR